MTTSELKAGGFTQVGILTTQKAPQARRRKHGVYFVGSAPLDNGVYFLAHKHEIIKFGDTQGESGLTNRINAYLCNHGKTNSAVRLALENDVTYEIYFYPVIAEMVTLFGLPVKRSISPRSLEKALLEDFQQKTGFRPRLNRICR